MVKQGKFSRYIHTKLILTVYLTIPVFWSSYVFEMEDNLFYR